jgi:hypothetical protein
MPSYEVDIFDICERVYRQVEFAIRFEKVEYVPKHRRRVSDVFQDAKAKHLIQCETRNWRVFNPIREEGDPVLDATVPEEVIRSRDRFLRCVDAQCSLAMPGQHLSLDATAATQIEDNVAGPQVDLRHYPLELQHLKGISEHPDTRRDARCLEESVEDELPSQPIHPTTPTACETDVALERPLPRHERRTAESASRTT